MKKIAILLVAIMLISAPAFCAKSLSDAKYSMGLDSPLFGMLLKNDKGDINGTLGINYALGIGYKGYFKPLKAEEFNPYLSLGTFLLVIPYIGIGGDYVWDNGFYLGAGLIYIFPEIHGGFMF
jgi:hypothetical protein